MQPRRVIFPDTQPLVRDALTRPGFRVWKRFRPKDGAQITYRNDSGPDRGFMKTERYGVNVWHPSDQDAGDAARELRAELVGLQNGNPIVQVSGGTGPFEVTTEDDSLAKLFHYYFTVELMVRGASYAP